MYPRGYTSEVSELRATAQFLDWLDRLRDVEARGRIQSRIERLARQSLVILLAGGDKRSQTADIALARRLAVNL